MKTKIHRSMPACGTKNIIALLAVASLLAVAPAGWAASPSELLEHGIYAEETKGDLDAALKLYQQAVAEAKGAQAVAAQAQFRLGVCYYKKQDSAAAMAAFEQVVKDYPEQKELVVQAHDYLFRILPLLPVPWVDGEELRLDFKNPAGVKRGSIIGTVNAGETNGQKLWVFRTWLFIANANYEWVMQVEADAATLKPLRSHQKVKWGRETDTAYLPGRAEMKVSGTAETKQALTPGAAYEDEELVGLVRRLPLATNYSVTVSSSGLNTKSGDRSLESIKLQVVGVENVQVPAGTFECFKITFSTNVTLWFSTDAHRYPVKCLYESGAVAELAAINRRHPDESLPYREPTFGFSLTQPPGWVFDRYLASDAAVGVSAGAKSGALTEDDVRANTVIGDNPKSEVVLSFLDPELTSYGWANVGRAENLDGNAKSSPRVRAEADLTRIIAAVKAPPNLQIRTNSWQELSLAGHPAASVIVDYEPSYGKQTAYCTWIFDDTSTVKIFFISPANFFETKRPAFEAIVRSYTHSQ